MRKTLLIAIAFASITSASAQKKTDWSKVTLDRSGDHLMVQLSSAQWAGAPDSISSHIKGFSRGLNIYAMLDKPFKGNPRMSVAFGVGVSASSMSFSKMNVDLKASGSILPFTNLDAADHFKKYRLLIAYLEVPLELRFSSNPVNQNKSWKFALGAKVGTMINAHTKGKTLQDENGSTIGSYTEKINSKRFFNGTRISATARIGYGHFSLFGSYQVNQFLKDGSGADIKPYQIGITLSGL